MELMTENDINTILVVDDEEGILEITEEYFGRKGYQVYTAANGLEAVKVIESVKIDCCFTDINMPEMDGLELAEHIRKMDITLPVVVMTGFPSLENTISTLKNGVVDFLVKPVNMEQMELTFRSIMKERGLFVENLILKEEVERKERLKTLNDELLSRLDELNVLNRIMEDFASSDSSYSIFNKVVALGVDVLKADNVNLYIYVEQDASFISIASNDWHVDSSAKLTPELNQFFLDVLADDKPCLIALNNDAVGIDSDIYSFIAIPIKIREKAFGVVSSSIKQEKRQFTDKDVYYMSFIIQKAASAIENIALYENIYDNLFSTLYAFVAALEARDSYTRTHSKRVSEVASVIGRELNCTEEELNVLGFAGHLHDIGKIGIRDDILLKPGKLTTEEFEKIKEHPAIGADIVGQLGLWDREQEIIRHHHESFDGSGYPDGLKGEQIPHLARMLSVADAFDAMASDRAYRKKMDKSRVVSIIIECSGTQFDPNAVKAFLRIVDDVWPHDS